MPAWDAIAGHPEAQLAAHARSLGSLEVVSNALLGRYSAGPALSIVVCTRNRADEIAECIAACVALDLAGNDSELIVVDNGSTDSTPTVIEDLAAAARRPRAHRARAGGGALARPQLRARSRRAATSCASSTTMRAPVPAGSSTCGSRSATPAS